MAKSLSRKSMASAIKKCKSKSAKLLHKKAKTPAQRRNVLGKAAKRCTKKKVLARRQRSKPAAKKERSPVPAPQPIDMEEEEKEPVYPPEFIIRQIYPVEFQKSGFDTMEKPPKSFNSIHLIANEFIAKYANCDECMITKFVLENEENGNQTIYTFEPTDPEKPEVGRFFVDIYVDSIPEEFKDRVEQMINDVRNADCDKVEDVSEERQQEVLRVIETQQIAHPFTKDVYEGIQKAEENRKEECATLMPDME